MRATRWTKQTIIAALRRWRRETGKWPRRADWTPSQCRDAKARERWKSGEYPHSSQVAGAQGRWPRWADAIEAAGGKRPTRPYTRLDEPRRSRWEREEILAAIRAWTGDAGEPPTYEAWKPDMARRRGRPDLAEVFAAGEWPDGSVVARRFGSWRAALEAALED